ncbi:Alpha/Beta hydrolase protein [Cercophora newfieldiana]|uniref:Alpha/Beta hydrolase protein n=1 Tax=Cercophora newfieldiana TaxID=92897 RepID=A0AA40CJG0_9PEZI|nr:Alpha/Beta hydrolase protein [Cercophora newfieldiana]
MNPLKALTTLASLLFLTVPSTAQIPLASPYTSTFNSTFFLSPSQIQTTNLSHDLTRSVETIINFERSQLAHGGPLEDDFYTLPPLLITTSKLKPGTLVKVQDVTDPSQFAIPPNTALSRILYTTTDFNGSVIPTSGFILWPFSPRPLPGLPKGKIPVVIWAHGTSGFFAPQAPSSHRGLWYGHSAPFTLALAGYAVFAPDYAGLGVGRDWSGRAIPHQYHATPAAVGDALFGLRAVREAFSGRLDERWVVMGHSQGGAVAWGVAEALASRDSHRFDDLAKGFRGAIAVSPTTDMWNSPFTLTYMLTTVGFSLDSIFPNFNIGMWLTPLGVKRAELVREVQGGIGVISQLFLRENETLIRREDWNRTWHAEAIGRIGNSGRRDFKGPLLVIQGAEDLLVPYEGTANAVNETAKMFPERDLEFLVMKGVGHTPVLDASRQFWLDWIEDRLGDQPLRRGFKRTEVESVWPVERYLHAGNSVTLWAGLPEFEHLVELRL